MEKSNRHKPKQYAVLGIDAVELSKANHCLESQISICEFQISKYNMRKKDQSLEDVDKLIFYANWKKDCVIKLLKL